VYVPHKEKQQPLVDRGVTSEAIVSSLH